MDTLEDIIDNPGLFICGSQGVDELKQFTPLIHSQLISRVKSYEEYLGIPNADPIHLVNDILMKDVFERKAVLILKTVFKDMIKIFYPHYNLEESQHKYNYLFRYSYVSRSHVKHKHIYRLYEWNIITVEAILVNSFALNWLQSQSLLWKWNSGAVW